ncbi:AI-2E family transporter [candidate division KSB1 bacterium]|nr:AI-2E family transporter [candidate division KSB1 bacterium]
MNHAKAELTIDKQLIIIIASGVLGLLVIWLATYATLTFVPVILSFMLASALEPILAQLEAISIKRTHAIFLVLLVVALVLIALAILWFPRMQIHFNAFLNDFSSANITTLTTSLNRHLDKFTYLKPLESTFKHSLILMGYLTDRSVGVSPTSSLLLLAISFVPFIAFFLLRDGDNLKKSMIRRLPNRFVELTIHAIYNIDQRLREVTIELFFSTTIIVITTSLAFYLLAIPSFLAVSIFVGLVFLIPYFGTAIATILAVLIMAPISGFNYQLIAVIVGLSTTRLIYNLFLMTKIAAKQSPPHPLIVLFFMLVGMFSGGLLGLIIILPLFRVITAFIQPIVWSIRNYRLN